MSINLNLRLMVNLDVLVIVLIVGLIMMAFRHQILEIIWKVFYANLSDEKLEKLVRKEYETYELNRQAYTDEGLDWLLQMAKHLQTVWKAKYGLAVQSSNGMAFVVFAFWQRAEDRLQAEINRRNYFNSLT